MISFAKVTDKQIYKNNAPKNFPNTSNSASLTVENKQCQDRESFIS